jgi:hypothetical protein
MPSLNPVAPAIRSFTTFRSTANCPIESSIRAKSSLLAASRSTMAFSTARRASVKLSCAARAWFTAINGPS